jgi:hypothetical protein
MVLSGLLHLSTHYITTLVCFSRLLVTMHIPMLAGNGYLGDGLYGDVRGKWRLDQYNYRGGCLE